MALNAAVIMPPLQQILWDKTLDVPLSNGQVFFWEDSNRTIPKNVYELTGTGPGSYTYVSLGAQLTLSGIGSFIDSSGGNIAIYLWPFTGSPNDIPPSTTIQNYYITVYSSTSVFQFDIPNWPGVTESASPVDEANTTENIISNGQFVDVNFPITATGASPFTITVSGTNVATEIAPDWSIVTSGSGTLNVYRQVINDSTTQGNPAYAIGIASTGFSQPLQLRQRILAPRTLAGQFASGTFLAQSFGGPITLTMNYTPSISGTIQQICTGLTLSSGFSPIFNSPSVQITNPGAGTGYIDITILIPLSSSVQISCVQLCGVINAASVVAYLQETPEREVDHLFHYFQPKLNFKPIPSLLTGWDFPLNPKQFGVTSFTNVVKYVWDQTIMCSSVGIVNVAEDTSSGALDLTTTNANEAFYMIQYLSGPEAVKTTLSNLSVNINAYSQINSGVIVNAYLYYSSANGTIPLVSGGTTIGSITNVLTGQFSLSASGWTLVPQFAGRSNNATLPLNTLTDTQFTGWNAVSNFGLNGNTVHNFAIVITFAVPISGTIVLINSVSCVPGDIPTRPAPQTQDEVLRECQYYYEKSYLPGVFPLASTTLGSVCAFQNSELITATNANANFYQDVINLQYKQVKRVGAPAVFIYSVNGVLNDVTINLKGIDSNAQPFVNAADVVFTTYWTATGQSDSSIYYVPVTAQLGVDLIAITPSNTNHFIGTTAWAAFQYVIDARLGVV